MTVFLAVALAMLFAALAAVLLPLLRAPRDSARGRDEANLGVLRDQLAELDAERVRGAIGEAEQAEARRELERRVLEETGGETSAPVMAPGLWMPLTLAVALPVAALLLYLVVGTPQILVPGSEAARLAGTPPPAAAQEIAAMVDRHAERLKNAPDDLEGWLMLARAYLLLERFPEAARAFAHLLEREPGRADLWADYADALAAGEGGTLAGRPIEAVRRALALDPKQPKALALAGTEAFQRGDWRAALAHWEALRAVLPAESPFLANVEAGITDARARLARPAAGDARLAGRVRLSPALASRISPDDVVFVFARAAEGPGMPLAVLKRRAAELPFEFTLDQGMAISPERGLAGVQGSVIVSARVSRSGSATPASGDLEGRSGQVRVGASGIEVVIDTARP